MADFSPGTGKNNSSKLNTEIQESVEDRSGSFEDETVPGTSVPEEETAAGADGHSASRRKEKDRNKAASGGEPGEGAEATAGEKEAADGLVFEGMTYTFEKASDGATNGTTCYPIKPESEAVNTDWFFSEGDHGYLVYKYGLKWEPRKYCRPIPLDAYTINPALGQNYDWK